MSESELMTALDLLEKANDQGIKISFDKSDMLIHMQQGNVPDKYLIETLRSNKQVLWEYFEKYRKTEGNPELPVPVRAIDKKGLTHIPLSFSQERLWVIDQLQGSVQYHIPYVIRLKGYVSGDALELAFRKVVDRHEILRTVIEEEGGKGYQVIRGSEQWSLRQVAADEVKNEWDDNLEGYVKHLMDQPFNLSADYMLRVTLIRESATDHLLVVVVHHIAADAWSIGLLIREVEAWYEGGNRGVSLSMPGPALQYADYAIWQRSFLTGERMSGHLAYWKQKLAGIAKLELPTDFPRPAEQSIRAGIVEYKLPAPLYQRLLAITQQTGTTLFMVMLSAFKALLYRYTRQSDISVGIPVAGRQQEELEKLIGFFVNTVVCRNEVTGREPFQVLLEKVKKTIVEAFDNQHVPFEKVVEAAGVERDLSRTPLFQVMFSLQNTAEKKTVSLGEAAVDYAPIDHTVAQFDLNVQISASGTSLQIAVTYCSDLFKRSTVERMVRHFERILDSVADNMAIPIDQLRLIEKEEEKELLQMSKGPEIDFPLHRTVVDLFEEVVVRTPGTIAVTFGNHQLSYQALNERSNQLAHFLRKAGVQEGTLVPLCVNRSLEMIVGILGILKAGAAYLPLDPEYPADFLEYILKDAAADLILSSADCCKPLEGKKYLLLDTQWEEVSGEHRGNLPGSTTPQHLCYVLYTSGSTGRPKGVMIAHEGLTNRLLWAQQELQLGPADAVLQKTTFCFDVSVWELLLPLISGAKLVLAEPGGQRDVEYLKEVVRDTRVTTMHFVPSMLSPFLLSLGEEALPLLRTIICSGEELKPAQVQLFMKELPGVALYNLYGPTEATIDVSCYRVTAADARANSIPIGRPIANTNLYILDPNGSLCPVGINGELHIAGIQLARGYLNRPALTAEKFIEGVPAGEKLYRTGDIVRWDETGKIIFIGRQDDQVKIRGYRVELGEIARVMERYEDVRQAVVLAITAPNGQKRLVGYAIPVSNGEVSGKNMDVSSLQEFLRAQLPGYMVPEQLVLLSALPLLANGKLDKTVLEALAVVQLSANHGPDVLPATQFETAMAEIWKDLLGINSVSIQENFFTVGGDSIIAIQVVSRMKRKGYHLRPRDLFRHQTIAEIAKMFSAGQVARAVIGAEQGILSGESGLLPIQQWYLQTATSAISHFNQSVLLGLKKEVGEQRLQSAFDQLVVYHDALRLSYSKETGQWQQSYQEHAPVKIFMEVIDETKDAGSFADRMRDLANRYQAALDIESGNMFRVVLIKTGATQEHNRLLIILHHLITDGVSWRILLEDLEILLTTMAAGESVSLGEKTSSYRAWQQGLVKYGQSERCVRQLRYWSEIAGAYHPLPADKQPATGNEEDSGELLRRVAVRLNTTDTRQLTGELHQVYHTEINDILLAALASVVQPWTGRQHITIGLEGHGRLPEVLPGYDLSRTVGWFTIAYPLRLTIPGEGTGNPGFLIREVKEQLRSIPDKGLGYGVLRYINGAAELEGPAFDIVFNYLGQSDNVLRTSPWFTAAGESAGENTRAGIGLDKKITLTAVIRNGELLVEWLYNEASYKEETIATLAESYRLELEKLVRHCASQLQAGRTEKTPSDYGLGGAIANDELDRFLSELQGTTPRRELMESMYRLSSLQEGMLFHGLYALNSAAYVDQVCCELSDINLDIFRQCWEVIIQRHSTLRTSFYHDLFSIPVQCVYKKVDLPFFEIDYRDLSVEEQQKTIHEQEQLDRRSGFSFSIPPLMRVTLIRIDESRYRMVWTYHHIILDGWSLPVLIEEFVTLYEELVAKGTITEVEEDKYEDYIRFIEQDDNGAAATFWQTYLAGLEGPTLLPFIEPGTERTKGIGVYRETALVLDSQVTQSLQEFTSAHRITANTLMQGVWACLLHVYTGSQHIVYGVPVSGRPEYLANVEKRVGMYINTLPLHAQLDREQGIVAWLQDIQEKQLGTREYQYTALSDMQQWAGFREELFDSILIFENYPIGDSATQKGSPLQISNISLREQTNYPLCITIGAEARITILFTYNETLLQENYIRLIKGHFEHLILQILSHPEATIGELGLLTVDEKEQLLDVFNRTDTPYLLEKTVTDCFSEQAIRTPEAIAVQSGEHSITYKELEERSNQLAHYLQAKGIKKNTLVPICMDRTTDLLIGIFGILKAGGVYVPLDPDYPRERLVYMLTDTQCQVVLTNNNYTDFLHRMREDMDIIALDTHAGEWMQQPAHPVSIPSDGNHLAYVIYTSGSTGLPKGVMITHRSLINFLLYMQQQLHLGAGDKWLAVTTCNFDISCLELYVPLLSGATVVLASLFQARDGRLLKTLIEQTMPACMQATPSTWQMLLNSEWLNETGMRILVGGEALPEKLKEQLTGLTATKLLNLYGPTETTIWSSIKYIGAGEQVTIGKPIANTKMYVLDEHLQLVPVGVPGELYIGGVGVAQGYLNNEALTRERFILNPFDNGQYRQLYRTGDICAWTFEGELVYLGRADNQVKIRGYRIEPGEIEHVIEQSGLVAQAVVTGYDGANGIKRLIAYIIQLEGYEAGTVLAFLRDRLPEYMIPVQLIVMEAFPLTQNGKINRKLLPPPDTIKQGGFLPPRNACEEKLVDIWIKLLEVEQVGIQDSFFELGGNSLLAVRMLSVIHRDLGIDLTMREVILHPTVEQLSQYILQEFGQQLPAELATALAGTEGALDAQQRKAAQTDDEHITLLQFGGDGIPLFVVPGMNGICDYFHDLAMELKDLSSVYGLHMVGLLEAEKPLQSIQEIAERNILLMQKIKPAAPYRLLGHSLGGLVVYEMTRQLEKQGLAVETVVIVETTTTTKRKFNLKEEVQLVINILYQALESMGLINEDSTKKISKLRTNLTFSEKPKWLVQVLDFINDNWKEDTVNVGYLLRIVELRIINSGIIYTAKGKIKARTIVVRSASEAWSDFDPSLGWKKHAPGLSTYTIPGNHLSILKEENAVLLAEKLKNEMAPWQA